MNKKKNIVKQYTQPIYIPNDLYVCMHCTKEYIDKLFEFSDGTSIVEQEDSYLATTCYCVKDKKAGKLCTVVLLHDSMFKDLKKDKFGLYDTCAHESFHVADEILRFCGVTLTDSSKECYAYLTGWAAKCIFKTIMS